MFDIGVSVTFYRNRWLLMPTVFKACERHQTLPTVALFPRGLLVLDDGLAATERTICADRWFESERGRGRVKAIEKLIQKT